MASLLHLHPSFVCHKETFVFYLREWFMQHVKESDYSRHNSRVDSLITDRDQALSFWSSLPAVSALVFQWMMFVRLLSDQSVVTMLACFLCSSSCLQQVCVCLLLPTLCDLCFICTWLWGIHCRFYPACVILLLPDSNDMFTSVFDCVCMIFLRHSNISDFPVSLLVLSYASICRSLLRRDTYIHVNLILFFQVMRSIPLSAYNWLIQALALIAITIDADLLASDTTSIIMECRWVVLSYSSLISTHILSSIYAIISIPHLCPCPYSL